MNWLITPVWSLRAIAGAALVLVVMTGWRWWRERGGPMSVALRVMVIAGLCFIALNPQAVLPREHRTKPKLVIAVDTSASMATPDAAGGSRLATSLSILTNAGVVAALDRSFALDVRQFDANSRPASLTALTAASALGDASDVGAALLGAISDLNDSKSQAGVLLVSDGRATGSGAIDAAQVALARSVPIWTWCLGGRVPRHDVWVETASSEAMAFSGAEVELGATIRAVGYTNRSFKVDFLKGDQLLDSKEVIPELRAGTTGEVQAAARVVFRSKAPASGEERYVFRVASQPEEADVANNERAVFLRSVGEKVRVLLAEGQPHWDTKFLVQALKQEAHVDLTAVYRLNAERRLTVVSTAGSDTRVDQNLFPRTKAALEAFDIVVLGRGAEAFFDTSTESLVPDFVNQHGGSVVFARGKAYGGRFQPFANLDPLAWGEGTAPVAKLRPTVAGRENPILDLGAAGTLDELLDRLPALEHASVTLGEKPLAVVLAAGVEPGAPILMAYQRTGQGKALNVNASGLWRWAFRESGQQESELAYRRFWISVLQWLLSGSEFLPGSDFALTSARRYYTSVEAMQFLVASRNIDRTNYQPRLVIEGNGRAVEVEPRARGEQFVAEAGPFPPGQYQVTLRNNIGRPNQLSQRVEVVSASVEKQELSADPELMRQLAETSGGRVLGGEEVSRMPQVVEQWEAARQLAHRQQPLWDRWWALLAMMGLLGTEWWLRRRVGLV